MIDKKETRPRRQPEAGQTEKIGFGEANFPGSDFSTGSNKTQAIFDLLPVGESNSISSKQLANIVGASSVRDLQNRIAAEREQGALILSTCRNCGGYFRPSPGEAGKAEIKRYIATLRARALNTLHILRAAKAAIASDSELAGQIDFEEMEVLF